MDSSAAHVPVGALFMATVYSVAQKSRSRSFPSQALQELPGTSSIERPFLPENIHLILLFCIVSGQGALEVVSWTGIFVYFSPNIDGVEYSFHGDPAIAGGILQNFETAKMDFARPVL